jgi:hypothetical protein
MIRYYQKLEVVNPLYYTRGLRNAASAVITYYVFPRRDVYKYPKKRNVSPRDYNDFLSEYHTNNDDSTKLCYTGGFMRPSMALKRMDYLDYKEDLKKLSWTAWLVAKAYVLLDAVFGLPESENYYVWRSAAEFVRGYRD